MDSNDKYKKVVSRLREVEPTRISDSERNAVIERILSAGKHSVRTVRFFSPFAWAENRALRNLLGAAAFFMGAIFLWQQITINNRVRNIESYMSKASIEKIGGATDKILPSRLLMSGLSMGVVKRDSILVSSYDLLELIERLEAEKDKSAFLESLLKDYSSSVEPPPQNQSNRNVNGNNWY